jgi:hypothetical protein
LEPAKGVVSQQTNTVNQPELSRNLPSPSSAIRPMPSANVNDMSTTGANVYGFQNHPAAVTSPLSNFTNGTLSMEDRAPNLFLPPTSYDMTQPHPYSFPMHSTYQDMAHFQPPHHYIPQQPPRYTPKSLDGLVPDPPGMMGMRPAPQGVPVPTFSPHPSMMNAFSHDNSFPSHLPRRNTVNIPTNLDYNPLSHQHYMSDMNQ